MKKDLFQYVAENYYKMSKDELRTIATEALFHLSTILSKKQYEILNEEIIEYSGIEFENELEDE